MKKIYSFLALSLIATATTFAAEPIQLYPISDTQGLTAVQSVATEKSTNDQKVATSDVLKALGINPDDKVSISSEKLKEFQSRPRKVRSRAESEWTDLGVTTMTDGLLYSFLSAADIFSNQWYVGLMSHNTDAVYDVYQPYYFGVKTVNDWAGQTFMLYDDKTPQAQASFFGTSDDWIIEVDNPRQVNPWSFYTGINAGDGLGHIFVFSCEDAAALSNDPLNFPMVYGTMQNGEIVFPVGSLYYWLPENTNPNMDAGSMYRVSNVQKVALPEGMGSYVTMNAPYCGKNDELIITGKTSEDIAKTVFGIAPGEWSASEENLNTILSTSQNSTTEHTYTLQINPLESEHYEIYTTFAIGVDENNDILSYAVEYTYAAPTNDADYYTLDGKAQMVDNIIAGYLTNWTNETLICEVQANKNKPGIYRLVSPYTKSQRAWKYASQNQMNCPDHDHYIIIDASDPNKVVLEESPLGVDLDAGQMRVNSLAYNYIKAGQNPLPSYYGKKDGQTITFPASQIVVSEKNYNGNAWYYTNKAGKLSVKLPTQNAIDDISIDSNSSASPVYYNLQGVRVDNPVPGQLLIVRQGNNVTKQIFK